MGFADALGIADVAVRGHLGQLVTYTPGVGDAVEVQGVFDAAYQNADLGEPGMSTVGPAVFLSLADLPSNPEIDADATVTVDGVGYVAHTVKPDGLGGVVLLLHLSP